MHPNNTFKIKVTTPLKVTVTSRDISESDGRFVISEVRTTKIIESSIFEHLSIENAAAVYISFICTLCARLRNLLLNFLQQMSLRKFLNMQRFVQINVTYLHCISGELCMKY